MVHVELVEQEACDFVAVRVNLLAFWVFVAEGYVSLNHWVAFDVKLFAIVVDSFDRGLVPDPVVVTAVKLVAFFEFVPNQKFG